MLIKKKQMMPIKMLYCFKFSAGDWAIGLYKKVMRSGQDMKNCGELVATYTYA